MATSVVLGGELREHARIQAATTVAATTAGVVGFSEVPGYGVTHQEEPHHPPGEKKWPGWPGDNVFRLIVPLHKVGAIIGRKGEFVKKMCEETRSRIKILDGVPGTLERIVLVSAKEDPEASLSPAMDGLLRVHRRVTEGTGTEGEVVEHMVPGGVVQSRLLVTATQAGSLIGRQGATIRSIQEVSGATVRIMPVEELPLCALADDRMVEIQGDICKVQRAMELVITHLRKFLVDRSVLQLFEFNRAMSSQVQGQQSASAWSSPSASTMPVPTAYTEYYQAPDQTQSQQYAVSIYGGDPGQAQASNSAGSASSSATAESSLQASQQLQVPLSYADAIIGAGGANISYIRQTSGATISIQETPNAPGEITIDIHGQAAQVQTAQQLLQNFMVSTYAADYSAYATQYPQTSSTIYSPSAYGSQYNNAYLYYSS